VASGGHPDLLTIERPLDERKGTVKNNLDVDTARKVTPFLRKTASDGGWRVVIVDDADTMNRNAQNALLKILEEPPKNTLLILICHRLGHMIPTIRSRCRVVDFAPLSKDHLNDLMQKEIGGTLSLEEQEILAFLSEGSIGVAKIILDTNGIETAQNVFDILKRRPFDKSQIHQLANNVSKDDIFKNIERVFLKIIEAIVFSKAQNQPLEAPLSAMNFDGDLQDWLKKYEEMKTHFQQAHTGNLDKKLATLNAFFIFEN
jgi:DNA polymerase-3 subunit delta'